MGKKIITYNEAIRVFEDHSLVLDTTFEEFNNLNLQKTKLKCHCEHHPNTPLEYFYGVVKSGRFGCRQCRLEKNIKKRNWTDEEKLQFIISKGYTYLSGDLSRVLNRLELLCPVGHECNSTINDLCRCDCVCNICNGKLPQNYWTVEKLQKQLNNIQEFAGYIVVDIDGSRAYIKCPNEKHPAYWASIQHLVREHTICRECYYDNNGRINWNLNKAKELLLEYGFTMVDESQYKSSHNRIACYDELGFIYMLSIHMILRGRTKFSLWKGNPYAVHNINLYCKLFRPDYEFLDDEYKGSNKFHRWKYIGDVINSTQFNREFELKFGHFVNSNGGHPMLSKSILEAKCENILQKYNIKYKTQKTFEGCVYKNKLRFDFYFILNNQEYCIETDGLQHKIPVEKFGGMEEFIKLQEKDEIKNKYCKDHNIKLIRIPQSKFLCMEDIIIKELGLTTQN